MTDESTIRVVITGVASDLRAALDGAKGDLGGLKAAIKDVPNQIKIDVAAQTAVAVDRLRLLKLAAGEVPDKIEIKADADTGIASAKLRLLKAEARDTETAIARAQLGGLLSSAAGGGGGGGGLIPGAGVLGNPFGASAGLGSAAIGGAPAIAGVAGAATAVVGSAGAGLLGAGAIGTSAVGVLAVGLGSIAAVAIPAVAGIKAVTTATDALEKAQADYGKGSKEAQQAQANLNGVIADAGPLAATIASKLGDLGDEWSKVSKPAQQALLGIILPALKLVAALMPTVASIAKTSLDAIGKALGPVFAGLSSPAFRKVLTELGDAFAKLAAPVIGAGANLIRAFLNVAVAASPFLIQIADAFERWTRSFADSLSPGAQLTGLIRGLVGQLHSWWDLAKSLGAIMVTIFSAGAGAGQGLVNMLTGLLTQWNAWLNTKSGQQAMTTFFKNSATLVVALFDALGPLIGSLIQLTIDLMPTFTLVLKAITPIFNVAAGAVSALAGALGSRLVQAVAVAALVFLPGGPIILGLVALGLIISHLPQIIHALSEAWRTVWDAMKIAFERSLSFILGGLSTLLGAIATIAAKTNIKILGVQLIGVGDDAVKGLTKAQTAIDAYRATLDGAAAKSKTDLDNIGTYHETAADRVNLATTHMTQVVQTGIVGVDSALGKEMAKLGVTVQSVLIGASGHPLQSKPAFGKAGGGMLVQIGLPGEKGHDAIPMSIGGTDIRVGAGEQAAIFNHEQQAVMNSRLADIGGLPGLFSKHKTPHYMAQGGLIGNVSAMVARANFDDSLHQPYLWGGGHGGFDNGPWDCSGVVSDILHAGGVLDAPRVSGDFMNYGLPGPGAVTLFANPTHVYMSIDGKFFGTSGSNPGGGAGWFDGAARPGFAVRHVGGNVDSIKQPAWTGPGGVLGQIGKQDLKLATRAANQELTKAMASSFSGTLGGGQHSENLQNQAIGKQMMLAAGFGADQWPALQALWSQESGWDANAVNSSSGAYGIPQALGHGHPYALGDVRAQVAWGLDYIRGRYGNPAGAEAHEQAFHWYELGGMLAGGGPVTRNVRSRAPSKPPKGSKHHHPHTSSPNAKFIPKDALKGLLDTAQLGPDRHVAAYERDVTVLDQRFTNLLASQATHAVDDPPLVTLTDADVAALDPSGALGYETGDEIVNKTGMVAGRFFGPGGKIQGGSFHPGASTRLAQIVQILANRRGRMSDLLNERGAQGAAIGVDEQAITQRKARKERIDTYLHKSVQRAQVVKRELDLLRSKDLAGALRRALSAQAISGRIGDLRTHLNTVTGELSAEKKSQAGMIPLNRDPSHTNELEAQAANIRDSITVEQQLGRTGSSTVQRAKSAIFRHSLTTQLGRLELTNRDLGGESLTAGTGGAIGKILTDISTLSGDRDGRRNTLADLSQTQLVPARAEIASYLKERGDIGKLANIQVRTPAVADSTAVAPTGPDLSALNALLSTKLAQTQQALAVSQSQFGVFEGFAPLLAGRLVGSFATGIDFVPRTGLALVHKGETITPDPGGPFGNRAATVQTAQGPVEILLTFANNEPPLVKLIRAEMNQHALAITSSHAGQRARLLAGVRRP